jgi:hypothetical protein
MLRFTQRLAVFSLFVALFVFAASPAVVAAPPSASTATQLLLSQPTIGQPMNLVATVPNASQVHFFISTASFGVSTVIIDGIPVILPIGNAIAAGSATAISGKASTRYIVPRDRSLIGRQVQVLAVTISNGRVNISGRMPSGPILGDAIA